MRGTGQASLEAVAASFEPVLRGAGDDAATIGAQVFSVVDALDSSGSLRRALSDPSRSGQDKAGLVSELLAGKVDDRTIDLVSAVARSRWSAEADLVDALEELAADSVLAAAQSSGVLEEVEDELFRIDRMLVGQRQLRQGLTDRSVTPALRAALARNLLAGKVHPVTLQLVERAAVAPRGRRMTATLALLGRLAARRRQRLVAAVTSGSVLTSAQIERLSGLLERAYGRSVQLNISVDPEVIGGLRIQVGPEVVDSTVLARLEDARRRLAG
ncbi:F0F1 ATP synthase subunit delta [Actinotalea sp. K2]|uniref:F0F1 ATP synthase subunit delta n=1 Tax=Actinotalea sp. K2 TaxID=2939438 RepID=UPI002016BE69|nr:F0F1 ATP synthase subunit delta [Actinotalea sp. K2]MCL3860451.1 F0F1 ATP synthase subunit delta [Actinotalea sp. K2]